MCFGAIFVFSVIFSTTWTVSRNLTNLAFTNYLGANTDFVFASLIDHGLLIRTSISPIVMENCINCGIATARCNITGRRPLNEESVLSIVREWVAPLRVERDHHLCQACWDLAVDTLLLCGPSDVMHAPRGHVHVCVHCGRSLLRNARSHRLRTISEREERIYNVISEWILPRTIGAQSEICHSCWVRADRAARHFMSQPSTSTSDVLVSALPVPEASTSTTEEVIQQPSNISEAIILPDYIRAIETERRCFIEGCRRSERHRIPDSLRKNLLNMHKLYIPANNRLCDYHLYGVESWDVLIGITNNFINSFSARHIQDMLALKTSSSAALNFEDIDSIEDHIFYYWIGLTKVQFNQLLNESPTLVRMSKGVTALAAYLMKLRTGDPDDRLATLLQIPRTTLSRLMKKARAYLIENYVPHHLGLNHINRQQLIDRTLMIPSGLFGSENNESKPVVIFDGTYIQKSSNYMYQKDTYSLHKYRNLVKPFLIVCTDGYIIDVLGPYPATMSDSDIMKEEFKDGSTMREYFQPGDAFILDRGFRDALPLLNSCGYRTYVPASLQQGETQLSTIEANKSRAVTICRWVVEVVNGRFKRDFKLLRQDYFNVASSHLMQDVKVAAALINAFHPVITNRDDAGEILQIINENMYRENRLANYVVENNLNRRRLEFRATPVNSINVLTDFPRLTYSELILVSLGTYQIKQARSYYGEHVRADGSYVIEVWREVDNDFLRELSLSNSTWLLRGRIHSRHISRKTYFVYILVDSSLSGRQALLQYYCNCIVGRRTVGCCAHIMSIVWYLSWARYQEYISPPAHFLDSILVVYEDE
ncbi:uncharacterized protein LOC123876146 isoform X1 [Maniola jurtina]|uniref:uncharacterized protein LOC123876146 isoform X1 n=2 Tax=Maniola jurtina TaxID=191418 RepID=UPI001E68EB58|nr:uncharacterized protein LOC123876146 isoform X1 [Maniola jurtina]